MITKVCTLVFIAYLGGSAHSASAQRSCVDFSGRYVMQGEDGQVRVGVSQVACSRVLLTLRSNYLDQHVDSTAFNVSLDDRWQTSAHGLWGDGAISVRAHVHGDTLSLFARPIASADTSAIAWGYDFIRRANGDLCSRFIGLGETSFHTAARVDGASADAVSAAAERGVPHC